MMHFVEQYLSTHTLDVSQYDKVSCCMIILTSLLQQQQNKNNIFVVVLCCKGIGEFVQQHIFYKIIVGMKQVVPCVQNSTSASHII